MKLKAATQHRLFQPAIGAALTALCGLALWKMPLGEIWVNASYDYLFLFGARPVTNQVALILMDNMAFNELHQIRGQPWARTNHANLLNKLADAGCPLVVFDVVFAEAADPTSDKALAQSLARQRRVVLAAEQARGAYPGADSAQPTLPAEMFLEAAHTNWGVAWFGPDFDLIVRKHWPFGAQGPHPSLPWVAAQQAGAKLSAIPAERWLRYYGPDGA